MAVIDGVLSCAAGRMMFSPRMHQAMSERFADRRPRQEAAEVGKRIGRWYRPGCGVQLRAGLQCPECEKSIFDKLGQLVELHPHADC